VQDRLYWLQIFVRGKNGDVSVFRTNEQMNK
jgi:hypothetical protein